MSPARRRLSAFVAVSAAAAFMIGLGPFPGSPLVAAPAQSRSSALPAAAVPAGQETIVDLSGVPSAPEYRTDEPAGPGFLGSDAAILERTLARIDKVRGTVLRPDNRLARLARWVYEHLGAEYSIPPQGVLDALTRRLGLAEPLPHFLVIGVRQAPQLADVVSARLERVFNLREYTHIGGVAVREALEVVVVVALSGRHVRMRPVPRILSGPGRIELAGRLDGPYTHPELAHTLPGGTTEHEDLGPGNSFRAAVTLTGNGRHRLEIIAQGPYGPEVVANFPLFVGVPVDSSVEAETAPYRALPPGQVAERLFELINEERTRAGLGALMFDLPLAQVAMNHSEDMRANNFVSHVSPTTGSTEDRLNAAGIVTGMAAENVGKGYTPDEIHQGFMDSPGHREAILLPDVTHVGVGVVSGKEYDRTTYLVTEIFIRRIPPLGPNAKAVFLSTLNGLREKAGAPGLKEDAVLTRIADEAAREFLANQLLTENDLMAHLRQRLAKTNPATRPRSYRTSSVRSILGVLRVVGSPEEGAELTASDPKTIRARGVGIGIAQGTRPGLAPNSIVIVLIFVE